jgi:hypothetical protein
MGVRYGAAVAMMLAVATPSFAQEIEWKQTLNVPKGQNIPRDRADILGIELGDSYAEAKAKLEKLNAESLRPNPDAIRVTDSTFRLRGPGGSQAIRGSFVSLLKLERNLKSTTDRSTTEHITVHLSAPSSGNQVVGIERTIHYYSEPDQPRFSEVLAQMKAKLKAEPQVYYGRSYVFQFNDGKPFAPPPSRVQSCNVQMTVIGSPDQARSVNADGTCDVVMIMEFNAGISPDHAQWLRFVLSDNERVKANGMADYAFMQSYFKSLQENTRGAPPKL